MALTITLLAVIAVAIAAAYVAECSCCRRERRAADPTDSAPTT